MDIIVTKRIIKFVEIFHRKGEVCRQDFKGIPLLSYYALMKYFRENGLIKCNGVNDRNQKLWIPTEKGKKYIELVMNLKEVLENGKNNESVK